ncbi:SidA/IucD/PvdA family monooxygenase, partial [Mangrovactinospora gilvigrisea]|uniref:SidA/IucD/PvdA family monooxygenase n=1 Tax=Mangrovactinospora gilvigrisea TaxID=1428644 RepID=UPI000AB6F81D
TGTPPHIPAALRPLVRQGDRVGAGEGAGSGEGDEGGGGGEGGEGGEGGGAGGAVHAADYLGERDALRRRRSLTVVGSGQSAAEIYRDLLGGLEPGGYQLTWVTRSPRFFPLEYTKLTLEMTSPEYIDYFHALPPADRDRLLDAQKGLYKGIDSELINEIYDLLYAKSLGGPINTRLLANTAVTAASHDPAAGGYRLRLRQEEQGAESELLTEGLILATGYRAGLPAFLDPVRDRLRLDDRGRLDPRRDHSADRAGRGEILLQNAAPHAHGLATPDLGMGAYRNASLIRTMTGREPYPVEKRIAFQEFAL